jgi:predicted MFS family arabinose efflux permease
MVGVYRFWRDMGYALGALIAGAVADTLGYGGAIAIIAALTAASGLWVLVDMPTARTSEVRGPSPGDPQSVPRPAGTDRATIPR